MTWSQAFTASAKRTFTPIYRLVWYLRCDGFWLIESLESLEVSLLHESCFVSLCKMIRLHLFEVHPAQKEHSRKDNQRFQYRFAIRLRPTITSGFDLERHLSQEEERAVTWTDMVLL